MVAAEQGDLHRPFQPLSLPLFQPESTLTSNHEIRLGQDALRASSCCVAKSSPGLSPRCLTAVSWGTPADKEKEGEFISARATYGMAQLRFSNLWLFPGAWKTHHCW